jgi:hypothetical protein
MIAKMQREAERQIRVKDVNRLEKNGNEIMKTAVAPARVPEGNPDDIKNNQEKGITCCMQYVQFTEVS